MKSIKHPSEDMAGFSGAVREWFSGRFERPTEVQARTWELVADGENVLAIAPTGSGKTLAAFLWAIDALTSREAGPAGGGVRVLYVSPLKALAADVERNLRAPLAGIAEAARQRGEELAEVRIGMRTGDTPPEERRALVRKPPDILITTPESLYLMLTSKARETLSQVRTVIVDEIHSLAGSKRGAHLGVSLERLDALLDVPAQRIGLSATVRPPEAVARFLGGAQPVQVVASEPLRAFRATVEVPVVDMTAIPAHAAAPRAARARERDAWKSDRSLRAAMEAAHGGRAEDAPDSRAGSSSIWPYVEQAVLDAVLEHTSTIVFVNSRGLCERFTARLNELYARRQGGDAPLSVPAGYWSEVGSASGAADAAGGVANRSDMGGTSELAEGAPAHIAKAHHGSVSKERRREIEHELKTGELPCVVATSSLELGIDMGSVDLVIQLAPPPSVSSALQRIGRANHSVGGVPEGRMFPITRADAIGCAVAVEGMRAGAIEPTRPVMWPLDVLAQQTVAQVSMGDISADAWFDTVCRSADFAGMPRAAFDSVVGMLAGRYAAGDETGFAPRLRFDADSGVLSALPGAQRLAVGGAGTIPDRGLFPVVLAEGSARAGRKRVGELDEEMVHESRVGDVITLGTSVWRIKQITADRVVVDPAPGRGSRLPFWHGERQARGIEDGMRRGAFLRDAAAAVAEGADAAGEEVRDARDLATPAFLERLAADGLDANAQRNLIALIAEQRRATGAVPTDKTLVVEKCADEIGGLRVILHSPFGRRVHEPWALAVAQRIAARCGFDPKVMASDDGIVVLSPSAEEFDIPTDAFALDADEAESIVRGAVTGTALFTARFRECDARALLMRPQMGGTRAPLWLQRVKGGQLLEAALRYADFPMVVEAMRECLQDVYDMAALREVLGRIAARSVRIVEAETDTLSPLAAPLIFGYVGEHLYDADMPHAERAAALLSVDTSLLAEVLGSPDMSELLDADEMAGIERELQHLTDDMRVRDAEGAARLLRVLGPMGEAQIGERMQEGSCARRALEELHAEKRAFPYRSAQQTMWAATADAALVRDALGVQVPAWAEMPAPDAQAPALHPMDALAARFARTHAPFATAAAAQQLGAGCAVVEDSLARLAADGRLVKGAFGVDAAGELRTWADAGVLRRAKMRSLARARQAVQPVALDAYMRFLFDRQGIGAAGLLEGADGVAEVIAQFEGVFLDAALWEEQVLPARVADYRPAMLDELLAAGEVIWVGRTAGSAAARSLQAPRREVAFYPSDSPYAPIAVTDDAEPAAEDADALRALLWSGQAVSDSFACVRELSGEEKVPKGSVPRRRAGSRRGRARAGWQEAQARAAVAARSGAAFARAQLGRVRSVEAAPMDGTEAAIELVDSVLDRYGIMARDTALAAGAAGGMWALIDVLDRMEETGAAARGMFVEGLGPAQFAERETVEALRSYAQEDAAADPVVLSAADPACLYGQGIAWPSACDGACDDKPQRRPGALVAFIGGEPALFAAAGLRWLVVFASDADRQALAVHALAEHIRREARRAGGRAPRKRYAVERVNGVPALESPFAPMLADAGFVRMPDGLRLYADPF